MAARFAGWFDAMTPHTIGMHEITDDAKQRAMQENAKPAGRKRKRLSDRLARI
ncbi:hypothetical protein PBS_45150 [Paraburkholderia sp. 2C]